MLKKYLNISTFLIKVKTRINHQASKMLCHSSKQTIFQISVTFKVDIIRQKLILVKLSFITIKFNVK